MTTLSRSSAAATAAVMKDPFLQAQLERTMGHAPYGGADPAECLATAARISGSDLDGWRREWLSAAGRARRDAELAVTRGDRDAARQAYLRASNYFRTAGVLTYDREHLEQLRATHAAEVRTFRAAAELMDRPPTKLEIPFERGSLPGYFFPAGPGVRPTMIITTGYDGTAEELYFSNAAAAVARGYHALTFDGPGQGSMLLDRGVPLRPDWENVVGPVIDHAITLPGVDRDALVLAGLSLGGYLAPRAAAGNLRLAACVSDCGPYDLLETTAARFPGPLGRAVRHGDGAGYRIACRVARRVQDRPTAGWALRRNLLVHDAADVDDFFRLSRQYSLRGREHLIACPTFVCSGEQDDLSALAPRLVEQLRCEHEYVEFRAADGCGSHCHSTGRSAYHDRLFAWLGTVLTTGRTAA